VARGPYSVVRHSRPSKYTYDDKRVAQKSRCLAMVRIVILGEQTETLTDLCIKNAIT
jgi:hypothetical protein